jgi:hypothetical protein
MGRNPAERSHGVPQKSCPPSPRKGVTLATPSLPRRALPPDRYHLRGSISYQPECNRPVRDSCKSGAGNGARTRDPQLGN